MQILGKYLFSTAAAPFKKAFVNVDEPLASYTNLEVSLLLTKPSSSVFCLSFA